MGYRSGAHTKPPQSCEERKPAPPNEEQFNAPTASGHAMKERVKIRLKEEYPIISTEEFRVRRLPLISKRTFSIDKISPKKHKQPIYTATYYQR